MTSTNTEVEGNNNNNKNDDDDDSFSVGQADIGQFAEESGSELTEGKTWRSLIEVSSARSRKIRGSNYIQLATVDPETNEPRNRCVVFRGFLKLPEGHKYYNMCEEHSTIVRMITHIRSDKVQQVMKHPKQSAEIVWWFPKTSEQFRIRGQLLFVGGGNDFDNDNDNDLKIARKEQWGNMSDTARESFFSNEIPGEPYTGEDTSVIPTGGRDNDGKVLPPPDSFLLMLLIPNFCDYLRLTNMYRQIDELVDDEWKSRRVNP